MKKVLASFLAAYTLTNGQAPPAAVPVDVITPANPVDPAVIVLPEPVDQVPATPVDPIPVDPLPVDPAPVEPLPVDPAPVDPLTVVPPETPKAPATTAVRLVQQTTAAAAAPVTTATPVNPATTAAAVNPATPVDPTTAAPVAPVAPATTTAAPVLPVAPTTTAAPARPAPRVNPLCPAGSGVGKAFGPRSQEQACTILGQVAQDFQGVARCNDYSCCMCEHITCGYMGFPCRDMQFGDYGAIGVQSIWMDGQFQSNGASLECNGLRSCQGAKIIANDLWKGSFGGDHAGQDINVQIYNPRAKMELDISGAYALMDGSVEVLIGQPGTVCPEVTVTNPSKLKIKSITLNGFESGLNAKIAVRNFGCQQVIIQKLECLSITSCPNTEFILEGNVVVDECALPGLQNALNLPLALQRCVTGAVMPPIVPQQPGGVLPPFQPVPVTPAQPATPVTPVTPALPVPVVPQQPGAPVLPILPTNPAGLPPQAAVPILAPGSSAKLNCDGRYSVCSGQTMTLTVENNFVMECPLPGSCTGMTLTVELGIDPHTMEPVEAIDSIKFIGQGSGAGTTITFVDTRPNLYGLPLPPIKMGNLRCENPGTCIGLTINAGPGIDLMGMNRDCSEPHYCTGCTVNQGGFTLAC